MKLDKAIEIQNDYLTKGYQMTPEDLHAAMALGVEALKWEKMYREVPNFVREGMLPGETTDD